MRGKPGAWRQIRNHCLLVHAMNCGGFRSRSRGLQGRVGHGNFPVTSTGIQVKVLKSRFTWAPIQTGWLRPLKCNFEYLQNVMYHILLRPCSDPAPACSEVFCHCHIAPTYLWPCSDVSDVFGHCHNVPTLLRPCSDVSDVFSHSVTTITMLRPYSDVFSHTITILQFRTLTPLMFVMLHPLPDPRHHSRFCG